MLRWSVTTEARPSCALATMAPSGLVSSLNSISVARLRRSATPPSRHRLPPHGSGRSRAGSSEGWYSALYRELWGGQFGEMVCVT